LREGIDSDKAMSALSDNVKLLAQPQLAKDPATTVLGSSDKDRGFGVVAAQKLVKSWSKLTMEILDTKIDRNKASFTPLDFEVGDATIVWAQVRLKLATKPTWYTLSAFAIERKTATGKEIVALAYSP
jgi:hypothetical protein